MRKTLSALVLVVSLGAFVSARADVIWDFENGNDHGFVLKGLRPGTLPSGGSAWTIGPPDQFDGQAPAVVEGCHVVGGVLQYGPCNDPFGAAAGSRPYDFTNGRGQQSYLNTYNLSQWGDDLHAASNDQIATSPPVRLGEGATLTVWSFGGSSDRHAPELDANPTEGYTNNSCGVAVLSAEDGSLLASVFTPAGGGSGNMPAEYDLDLSAFAGRKVIVEVVDAFQGGWGWVAVDEILITNAVALGAGRAAQARDPNPPDGASDVPPAVALSWIPGEYAPVVNGHRVYFSASFDDVNDGVADAGRAITSDPVFDTADLPFALDFGATYHWRVDEANNATGWDRGSMWSFSVEPFVYSLSAEQIIATASSSDVGDPTNTINGSGMDADDLHSDEEADMWVSQADPNGAWIQYEFDNVYKLTELWVWNYNIRFEVILGYGFKDVLVEVSTDGQTWTVLAETQFEKADAAAGYAHNTVVDMGGVGARYVRLTANTNWSPMNLMQFGLSEVRFYHLPVLAREPQPSSGSVDVGVDAVLSWRPGRQAAAHEVHFGADEQAVADGTALLDTITEVSYAPGPLDFGTQYYWKIVEVNDAETLAAWDSGVWDFTTAEYMAVDDFESYTNDSPDRVFQTWVDGWGFSADDFFPNGNPGNGSGAAAGHDVWSPDSPHYEGSIIETDVVNSGRQALPMYYDNTAAPFYSEVERTFSPVQNWTANGADTLKLAFRGNPVGFAETTPGTITMSGTGADIYDLTDEFRFAYKSLTGDGSITVKVESVEDTHEWAKAGVMIRAGLDTLAQQVHMIATPSNRVEFMFRPVIGASTSAVATDADSTPLPHWVRLTRSGNTITGEYSADGVSWTQVTGSSSVDMSMLGDIYIGLAVTSHVSNVPTVAEFSNVQTSGGVSGQWQVEGIGVTQPSNDRADLYIVVTDSAGRQATLPHSDPDAVLSTSWDDWVIPISDLTDAGINPAAVSKMAIGVGNPAAPQSDGSGLIYIDDVLVGHLQAVAP